MASEGSNMESAADNDVQPAKPAAVCSGQPSKDDEAVSPLQTSDLIDKPLYERSERLICRYQFTFDPVTIRRELANTIILHDYPLSIIGDIGFKALFGTAYMDVSQSTLKSDITKIYEFHKDCAMVIFEETGSLVAITTDRWISCDQTRRYVAITGQIVDDDWKFQRVIMRFVNVPRSCTNELIAKVTVDCLTDWGLEDKVSTIAIDDDSSDVLLSDVLIDKLSGSLLVLGGKLLQMECLARTINLMVKDALVFLEDMTEKIRESILFWSESPQRKRKFREACHELGKLGRNIIDKLVLDSHSKWDTTFLMLERALSYKTVFSHLKEEESEFSCMPTEAEWELVEEICKKLRYFYSAMTTVSKYRTANLAFIQLCEIKLTLSEWIMCDNSTIRKLMSKMQEKFDRYFSAVRNIFAVASVLDPRLQLYSVSASYEMIYGDEAQTEIDAFRRMFDDVFNEYQAKVEQEKINNEKSSSSQDDSKRDIRSLWRKECRKRRREEVKRPEFDTYLEQDHIQFEGIDDDFDILSHWKWGGRYPTLQRMARDILAIPICSVAPEHMFDIGDRVLSPHRSRLHPSMVEKLMCSQSWLWTKKRGSYTVTNSYSWGTSDDYAAVERQAVEGVQADQS